MPTIEQITLQRGGTLEQLRRLHTLEEMQAVWNGQMELLETVHTSDYYRYTSKDQPETEVTDRPAVSLIFIDAFYSSVSSQARHFHDAQEALKRSARKLQLQQVSVDTLVKTAQEFTKHELTLLENFALLHAAPIRPIKFRSQLNAYQQSKINQYIATLSSDKPEAFRETVRRSIPRWIWDPIPFPESEDQEEDALVSSVWGRSSSGSMDLLANPDALSRREIPLHQVFESADALESTGYEDLAYRLRTTGITHVLSTEQSRNTEAPFFHYQLAGYMTGEVPYGQDRSRFPYQKAIEKAMVETWSRFQDEIEMGAPSAATEFLQTLAAHYPDHIHELFARSLVRYGNIHDAIDEIVILRQLRDGKSAWDARVVDAVAGLHKRRVITAEEVIAIVSRLPEESAENDRSDEDFLSDATYLLGEESSYGFIVSGGEIGVKKQGVKADLEVEIDRSSQSVNAVMRWESGQQMRYAPCTLSLSGEPESFSVDVIEGSVEDPVTAGRFRQLIARSIQQERVRAQEKAQQAKAKGQLAAAGEKPIVLRAESEGIPHMTREERIASYREYKDQAKRKLKTRKAFVRSGDVRMRDDSSDDSHTRVKELGNVARAVHGLEYDTVTASLREHHIEGVDPHLVIRKLKRELAMAEVRRSMFGEKVNMDVYGDLGKDIDLRQISWILPHSTALRVYLEAMDEGNFRWRGVIRKKSTSQQTRDIQSILEKIVAEKKSS